jgi:hypothetical protein
VHITFGIQPPTSFANLFGSWLHGLDLNHRNQILLGAAVLCWAIWLNRNDMVFNKAKANTSMQVIFRAMYWIRQWSMLHKEEEHHLFKEGCRRWETLIMSIFAKFGWNFTNHIGVSASLCVSGSLDGLSSVLLPARVCSPYGVDLYRGAQLYTIHGW